jgi:putative phosphoribosyl transferase
VPIHHHARLYADRSEAGRVLATLLSAWKDSAAIVFALPRGGVPVAIEVARALGTPLDLLYVRKIGAPFQPELALGAVVDGLDPDIVANEELIESAGISRAAVAEMGRAQLKEIERRRKAYGAAAGKPLEPAGRVAIVVDDGLATGASAHAAVQALKRRGAARVIVAVPVASPDSVAVLEDAGAEVVCPRITPDFTGVGAFYRDFSQLTDESVIAQLLAFRARAQTARDNTQARPA